MDARAVEQVVVGAASSTVETRKIGEAAGQIVDAVAAIEMHAGGTRDADSSTKPHATLPARRCDQRSQQQQELKKE